jgi:DNA modification methylase
MPKPEGLLTILQGDVIDTLRELPDESVQMCVTSPPYWGLRSYLPKDHPLKKFEIGTEKTPEEYVSKMVAVFSEVRRALKKDGTCWLNLGDSYCSQGGNHNGRDDNQPGVGARVWRNGSGRADGVVDGRGQRNRNGNSVAGLKAKDLVGIPWMTAFALRSTGWYLRSDIIFSKPNPMPESVTDRPTRAHEYIFLLSKSPKYYYNHEAIRETPSLALIKQVEEGYNGHAIKDYLKANVQDACAVKKRIISNARKRIDKQRGHSRRHAGFNDKWDALTPAEQALLGRNKRSVWTVAPANFAESHFATFPTKLIEPCILAGSRAGDVVIDPFAGSGTTGEVALTLGRKAVLIELNPDYIKMIEKRCTIQPGFPFAA